MLTHDLGVVVVNGTCGDVEVAEDFVASPSADDFDDVDVDATEEKCHRAACPQAACGDSCLCQADCVSNFHDCCAESLRDVPCLERSPFARDFTRAKWCGAGGSVAT